MKHLIDALLRSFKLFQSEPKQHWSGKTVNATVVIELFETMLAGKETRNQKDIYGLLEDAAGWDSPKNKLMQDYAASIQWISSILSPPVYSGKGPANTQCTFKFEPAPDDSGRTLYISSWTSPAAIVYLSITSHDADTLRFLKLEVIKKSI
jgi:hypothetical protein